MPPRTARDNLVMGGAKRPSYAAVLAPSSAPSSALGRSVSMKLSSRSGATQGDAGRRRGRCIRRPSGRASPFAIRLSPCLSLAFAGPDKLLCIRIGEFPLSACAVNALPRATACVCACEWRACVQVWPRDRDEGEARARALISQYSSATGRCSARRGIVCHPADLKSGGRGGVRPETAVAGNGRILRPNSS